MKVLIDIPSNYKERLDKDFDSLNTGSIGATSILMAVKEGIEIPDNATNWDVLKALFSKKDLHELWLHPRRYWWDEPYKAKVKEREVEE